jgi:hypothetical protein
VSRLDDYRAFLARKRQYDGDSGFDATPPAFLYDFQAELVRWALRRGRAAIFADCGMGKSPMQLAWADAVVRHTNRSVLIATPLAVGHQLVREAEKFGIEAVRVQDGSARGGARIIVTNYERVDRFVAADFAGMVCDESSILKNADGVRRRIVTEFLRTLPFRLLCTATAAPNDYVELGTSSEALGELGHVDMLGRFFRNEQHGKVKMRRNHDGAKWRLRPYAEEAFWRWVCSWARALRRPSDLGFDDARYALPPLIEDTHIVSARTRPDGWLFDRAAIGLQEEREERRRTIAERCERVAELVDDGEQALVWCDLNDEAAQLVKLIPDAEQVRGADSDEAKEEKLIAFADGALRVLVTKPKIGAWGLNLQRCAHVTFFPSHSYEQYYQGVRRCWRFGQTRPVRVDLIATEGQQATLKNLARKAAQADALFAALVAHMRDALHLDRVEPYGAARTEIPSWLSASNG